MGERAIASIRRNEWVTSAAPIPRDPTKRTEVAHHCSIARDGSQRDVAYPGFGKTEQRWFDRLVASHRQATRMQTREKSRVWRRRVRRHAWPCVATYRRCDTEVGHKGDRVLWR